MPQSNQVVIYARVSTSTKDQNPMVQIEELRRYCAARDWVISEEIIDHGYSGATDARPGFKRLQTLARQCKVKTIVCLKLDRLFRSLKHVVSTLEDWQSLGVRLVATRDSIDYTTPSGKLFAQILGSLAEFEKSLLVERTLLGLEYARSKGKKLGRPKVRDDQTILDLRAQGLSYSKIQIQLGVSKGAVCRAIKGTPKTSHF